MAVQRWDRPLDDSLAEIADLVRPRRHHRQGWTVWRQMVVVLAAAADRSRIGVGLEVGPYQRARQRLPLDLVMLMIEMGLAQTMTSIQIAMVQLREKVPLVPLGMSNFEELGQRRRLDLPMSRMVRPRRRQHHQHLSIGAIPPQYAMDDTTDKDTTDKGRRQKMIPNQFYPLR